MNFKARIWWGGTTCSAVRVDESIICVTVLTDPSFPIRKGGPVVADDIESIRVVERRFIQVLVLTDWAGGGHVVRN